MSYFDRFQQAVWEAYHTKRAHESELENPRPAALRNYCLTVWNSRPLPKDREMLGQFFSAGTTDEEIERSIRQFDTDKFKPIINYLKGETKNTKEKNIKLLAWLIDFEPRPYAAWRQQIINETAGTGQTDEPVSPAAEAPVEWAEQVLDDGETVGPAFEKSQVRTAIGKRIGWGLGMAAIASVILFFALAPDAKQCMYWHEDRYVATHCAADESDGTLRIALNHEQLSNFRKITRADTLTLADVNKVWYSKINNVVEFFIAPGFHPVHRDRALKIASKHIIEQHAGQNASN